MKIIGISDIHGNLIDKEYFAKCDIICICGDIMPLEIDRDTLLSLIWVRDKFIPWCESLPCKYVLLTPGNHDFLFHELYCDRNMAPNEITEMIIGGSYKQSKLRILIDSSFEYNDKLFYGTPWCPNLIHWAFYKDSFDLEQAFKNIPLHCDVLLTHCPSSIGDTGTVLQPCWNFGKRFGCVELGDALYEKQMFINYVLSGHIHSGDHNIITQGNMKLINVSLLDEDYKFSFKPFIFNI